MAPFYLQKLAPTSPITGGRSAATFADDTAILAIDPNPAIASLKLQNSLDAIQHLLSLWQLKANGAKSTHVTSPITKR
jgi:hypothetical protein